MCMICFHKETLPVRRYTEPDAYMKLIDFEYGDREFRYCLGCGLISQLNHLMDGDLEDIYKNYRSDVFRGSTLKETFDDIYNKPFGESENKQRFYWINRHIETPGKKILDVGSGYGPWPYILYEKGIAQLECLDPNKDSVDFINQELGIMAYHMTIEQYLTTPREYFDIISIVHVLEHLRDPVTVLKGLTERMIRGGKLFIEVPDPVEFTYLPNDHDDFNSTHLWFFDMASLYRLIEGCGFQVDIAERIRYEGRNLTRLRMIAHVN